MWNRQAIWYQIQYCLTMVGLIFYIVLTFTATRSMLYAICNTELLYDNYPGRKTCRYNKQIYIILFQRNVHLHSESIWFVISN
jgi:hypothetical protein